MYKSIPSKKNASRISVLVIISFFFLFTNFNLKAKILNGIAIANKGIANVFISILYTNKKFILMRISDSLGCYSFDQVEDSKFMIKTFRIGHVDIITEPFDESNLDSFKIIIRPETIPFKLDNI